MAKKKFEAPQGNPYNSIIQSTAEEKPQPEPTQAYYRFNAKFPGLFKDYLQEMSWRNRISINEYLSRLIAADMEKHPEWTDTLDVLNR